VGRTPAECVAEGGCRFRLFPKDDSNFHPSNSLDCGDKVYAILPTLKDPSSQQEYYLVEYYLRGKTLLSGYIKIDHIQLTDP
jgi:hypothetical protein